MSEILAKARQFAAELAQAPEVLRLIDAETALENDPGAKELWQSYFEARRLAENPAALGQNPAPDQIRRAEELRQKAHNHQIVAEYLEAQKAYLNLIDSVNFLLRQAVEIGDRQNSGGCAQCRHGGI